MSDLDRDFEKYTSFEYSAGPLENTRSSLDEPVDLLPEYCAYKDEGCSFAPSCLSCPLPHCFEDLPGGQQKLALTERNSEIVRLFTNEKKTVEDIMAKFKISRRTVFRALRIKPGRAQNE
jgi:hypothetical protein